MRLTVIGAGYVGLVTGTCFAEYGNTVVCIDTDETKVARLREGIMPIYEAGLEEAVLDNVQAESLSFSTDLAKAVNSSDIVFICVGTPNNVQGQTELRFIEAAATDIGRVLDQDILVVNKSTVPVGTCKKIEQIIQEQLDVRGVTHRFTVISNPEFLKEGTAVADCMRPDRVIVGVESEQANAVMKELYTPFLRHRDQYIEMDIASAEMTKYAANAMLATRISFINEVATLCELLGADVNQVRLGIGSDSRIGYSYIYPGLGYGGSCFPKDVRSLVSESKRCGYVPQLLQAVDLVNTAQKQSLTKKIVARLGEDLSGMTFALWGLAFKPDTDDMREAPSISVVASLLERGATLRCYDPKAASHAPEYLGEHEALTYGTNKYDILDDADALLLLTEWKEFKSPDFEQIKQRLRRPLFFDGKNQFDDKNLKNLGIEYIRIGLGSKGR